jgi:hypothetical protein
MNVPDGPTDVDERLVALRPLTEDEKRLVAQEQCAIPVRYLLGVGQSPIVAALDAIDPSGDPEHAHAEADRVLLAGLSPEVRAAYDRLVARAAWWAFS